MGRIVKLGILSAVALVVPGAAGDQIEPLANDVLEINRSLRQVGATEIQQLLMEQRKVTIAGVQQAGETVSRLTQDTFLSVVAAAGDRAAPTPPGADFYIMTAYNPFSFGLGRPTESFTDEVVERLNVIIRETAVAHGAKVADPYDLVQGNAASRTNLLFADIHPNANGYQALPYSLTQAW